MANGQSGNQGGGSGGNIPPVPNTLPNPVDMQAVVDRLEDILRLTNDIVVQSQRNVNSASAELTFL